MKKLVAVFLALAMILTLAACGKEEERYPELADLLDKKDFQGAIEMIENMQQSMEGQLPAVDGDNDSPPTTTTLPQTDPPYVTEPPTTTEPPATTVPAPTQPPKPTAEEITQISEYYRTVSALEKNSYTSEELEEYYHKLLQLTVVDEWAGSEYLNQAYSSVDPSVWDRQAVLNRFTVLENIKLTMTVTTVDHLGNIKSSVAAQWVYDVNGRAIQGGEPARDCEVGRIEMGSPHYGYEYDDGGRLIRKIYYNSGTYTDIYAITELGYDDAGNVVQATVKTNTETTVCQYIYNDAGQLVECGYRENERFRNACYFTYDDAGHLIREEKRKYDNRVYSDGSEYLTDQYIVDYTCDAEGRKIAGEYRYIWHGNETGSRRQVAYVYDELGREIQYIIHYGEGAEYVSKTYETTYGDFYIYTPAN